jgi:hypothetical protein
MTLVFLTSTSVAFAEVGNLLHCEIAAEKGKLGGVSLEKCVCIYDQSDAHLTPEIKDVIKQSQLAGISPNEGLLALGPIEEFTLKMKNFGNAINTVCGVSG